MSNSPPTDEEIDRMEELYEQEGNFKAVAAHSDIDYSRPTVTKWLNRRWEDDEEEEESDYPSMADNPFTASPDDEPVDLPEENNVVEPEPEAEKQTQSGNEDFSDILVDEPPEPNEILSEVLFSDPNIKEKHLKYVQSKFSQFGQMSPADVANTLGDIKINNKNQTINRVKNNYSQRVNKMVRDDPSITDYEEWGTLMTKVTGDPSYIQQARGDTEVSSNPEIQAPPVAGQPHQPQPSGAGFSPHQPSGLNGQMGQPQGQPQMGQIQPPVQNGGAPQQTNGQSNGLSDFEERLIEMLEQQMTGSEQKADISQPATEPKGAVDQLQELVELQDQVKQLQGDDSSAEITDQIEGVVNQLNQRIAQLESKLNEDGGARMQTRPAQTSDGGDSTLTEIAMLAERVDDPQILNTLIEMQTDPDVLKAKAKREEVENESAWKKSLAESLSPAAAEQAVSALASFAKNLSPPQQQAARQPQQQPQPQQVQGDGRGVEVVQEQPQQPVQQPPQQPETVEGGTSPLREEGLAEVDQEDDETPVEETVTDDDEEQEE